MPRPAQPGDLAGLRSLYAQPNPDAAALDRAAAERTSAAAPKYAAARTTQCRE